MNLSRALLAVAAFAFCAFPAAAQDKYPSKTVKIVVPFVPGGTSELLARNLAKQMGDNLGQNVIIENIGGAGGTLGTSAVARAEPDGYTLLFGYSSGLSIAPSLYANLQYDSLKSFTPIGTVARFYMMMVAHPSVPASNIKALIAHAKANPGKLSFGSPGVGSVPHLLAETLNTNAKIEIVHIPYKGMRPAILDLIAGRVQLAIDATDALTPLIKDGRIKPIVMAGDKRHRDYPNVPTVVEEGFPELSTFVWTALMAPAGLPQPIHAKLQASLAQALKEPELQKAYAARGYELFPGTPGELTQLLNREIPRWAAVIKASGAKVE